jgi:pyruvate formate lyase activating enzyme
MTAPGELVEVVDAADKKIRCVACGHRCLIKEGRRGICKVRYNEGGELRVPHGYVGALQIDPIEKKPFFHITPGVTALSFGMMGCDFHVYCQIGLFSTLRDENAGGTQFRSADELVTLGRQRQTRAIASTYNEPLINRMGGWGLQKARQAGMLTLYISNGNGTPEVIDYLKPWLDGYKIDLKTMQDKHYASISAGLQHVLNNQMGA